MSHIKRAQAASTRAKVFGLDVIFCAALAIGAAQVGVATAARAQDDSTDIDSRPHITVAGTASTSVAPDRAELRIGIEANRPTATDAWQAVDTITQAVVNEAKARGIKPDNLQTERFALSERFESVRRPDGNVEQVQKGFRASTSLQVRTTDLDGIGRLTQALLEKGATSLNGVDFTNSRSAALEDEMRDGAVRNARHQAELIAKAAGVRLGPLLQIEPPQASGASHFPVIRAAQAPAGSVQPGLQSFSAEVEATYAIE